MGFGLWSCVLKLGPDSKFPEIIYFFCIYDAFTISLDEC